MYRSFEPLISVGYLVIDSIISLFFDRFKNIEEHSYLKKLQLTWKLVPLSSCVV